MKAGACILAAILSVLMVQPIFSSFGTTAVKSSCSKSKPAKSSSSCQSKCSKSQSQEQQDKEDCDGGRCNPFMGCVTGNFYVHNYSYISIIPLILPKQQTALVNDNRISKQLTECWHPPEII